jgi:hypothetical protein
MHSEPKLVVRDRTLSVQAKPWRSMESAMEPVFAALLPEQLRLL